MFPVTDTEFNFSADFKVYDDFQDVLTSILECKILNIIVNIVEIILIV